MKSPALTPVVGLIAFGFHLQVYANSSFTLASWPSGGRAPYSLVSADINADGSPDLICSNFPDDGTGKTLTVLTNNGHGTFGFAPSPVVGTNPISVVSADVNADGKMDLVSASYFESTLSVLTNNGSGGFTLSSTPQVGQWPYSLVATDVNGDGKTDLVSANVYPYWSTSHSLSIMTNDGSGVFVLAHSPTVGAFPASVAAADINGDGQMDLITANGLADTLSVLTNGGGGEFVAAQSPGVGHSPNSVALTDVNGDGLVDVICTAAGDNTLNVLTNNGANGFIIASSPQVGYGPTAITAADINGDGKVDLISADSDGNTASVLTNNGYGAFSLSCTPNVGSQPQSVVAVDVNGDGHVDLVSANRGNDTLSVLINTPALSISRLGTSLIVSWPSSWTNWMLQQNPDLTTTNWSPSAGVLDDGTNKNLTIPSPTNNLFFRLSAPSFCFFARNLAR